MSSSMLSTVLPSERESWWDKSNRLDNATANVQNFAQLGGPQAPSFTQSLENILARSDAANANDGLNMSQAAPTSVSGEAVTFEELINSQNAQIREFAVLDQQPVSTKDWAVLGNVNPVTPSNFKALEGLSDGLMLSQRFANAIYAV